MNHGPKLNRRTVLRGLGTVMALPLFEAMMPTRVFGGTPELAEQTRRMAFLFVPNGMHMPDWTPKLEGANYDLPPILAPLARHQEQLLVLSGLTHDKARANGDGGGDHARAVSVFLTGCQPRKTDGADIRAGISVDQIAAQEIGDRTRFPSLEIGCERGPQAGNCDSGYSCVYSANISWRSEATPTGKEVDPRAVFDRIFGGGSDGEQEESQQRRRRYQKSVLDFVMDDARRLRGKLGRTDGQKLDEYLSSVRDVERQISYAERASSEDLPEFERPEGIPKDYAEHLRLMSDLLVLAFQGDQTRIATYMFANAGSNRSYRQIEVPEGHHELSHHRNEAALQEKISKINVYHAQQFAYLLDRMKETPDGHGSLLDNCMLVYGSGISDGNRHNHDDLPILLAGGGAGTIDSGRHVRFEKETPLNNLYLAMLQRMGVHIDGMGDSTGVLQGLTL